MAHPPFQSGSMARTIGLRTNSSVVIKARSGGSGSTGPEAAGHSVSSEAGAVGSRMWSTVGE